MLSRTQSQKQCMLKAIQKSKHMSFTSIPARGQEKMASQNISDVGPWRNGISSGLWPPVWFLFSFLIV